MTTFKELGLNKDLMKGLDDLGFSEPTPIQAKAIPFILESKNNLVALAQTGTGKTAAFGLPILNQIDTDEGLQAIIICPIRELCLQISQDLKNFSKHSKDISITPVYGGERIDIQIRTLKRGTNIVVGTPGRVHDLIRRKVLKLQDIQWVVLDEADEMLDMGFKDDLDAILEQTPADRQTLLFSATMSRSIRSIAKKYMGDAEEISVGEKNIGADKVSHEYYVVQPRDRFEALRRILDSLPGVYSIVFCRTRRETQDVADKLKANNYDAEVLHGDVSQTQRTKIMNRFKQKKVHLLIATDVAARGIDVDNLSHVINYNLPDQNEVYTHRSGRTGRAKNSGVSISLVSPKEVNRMKQIEKIIHKPVEFKKVPFGQDIYQNQINAFIDEIEAIEVKDIGDEKYFADIMDRLKKFKKEELIKLFLQNKFNHFMDESKNIKDLNANPKFSGSRREGRGDKNNRLSADEVNLKINIGRKHGFDIKGLFKMINSQRNLKGVDIGKIDLMPEFSVFSVDKARAGEVIRALSGSSFRGEKVLIKEDTGRTFSYSTSLREVSRRERGGSYRSRGGGSGRRSDGRGRSRSGGGFDKSKRKPRTRRSK